MSDGVGPDIFMIPAGEDAILSAQAEPVPGNVLNITDFESRFDSIFGGLIVGSGSSEFLMGVPLGYETLGIFYNRSLIRTGVPQNFTQIEFMYADFPEGKYPANFGLGKPFVPNVTDVLPLFFIQKNIKNYTELGA